MQEIFQFFPVRNVKVACLVFKPISLSWPLILYCCFLLQLNFQVARSDQVEKDLESSESSKINFLKSLLSHELQSDVEWMDNGAFRLTQSTLGYKMDFPSMEWKGSLPWNTYDLDFKSPDALTNPVSLDENRFAAQLNGRSTLNNKVQMLYGGGGYKGFSDYRSVWFDEYFRQLYGDPSLLAIPGFDTYRDADPHGWNAFFGLRIEYLPSSGYLEIQGQYLRDFISPGYEIDFGGLIRNPDRLNTGVFNLSTENVLTTRLRSRLDYRYTSTSEREGRHFVQGSLNASLGERWVSRSFACYARE